MYQAEIHYFEEYVDRCLTCGGEIFCVPNGGKVIYICKKSADNTRLFQKLLSNNRDAIQPMWTIRCHASIEFDKEQPKITVQGTNANEVQQVSLALIEKAKELLSSNSYLIKDHPIKIFFCYTHEDELSLKELKKHLIPLERQGLISIWNDTDISPGADWEEEIDKHLNTAQIILLLISPDFMASDYCYSKEMKRAMERHKCGEVYVIPVILRHVSWQGAPFSKLQALPTNAKPIAAWNNQDEAYHNIAEGIKKIVELPNNKSVLSTSSVERILSGLTENRHEIKAYFCYCIKCKTRTKIANPLMVTTKNNKPAVKGVCSVCGTNVYLRLNAEKQI